MIRSQHTLRISMLFASLVLGSACTIAAPTYQDQTPAPDNSATNKQHDVTADKQANAPEDRELARKIRHSVVSDKSLSSYAHNVKIIVLNGAVTLKGPVHSEEEKKQVGDLAVQAAGSADKVTNDLSVKP